MPRLQKNSSKTSVKQETEAPKNESKSTKKSKKVMDEEEDQEEVENQHDNEDDDFEDCDDDEENKEKENGKTKKITLYDLLDVSKDATIEQIKKAYKQLALKIHPDKNKSDPEAKEKFQKIVEAYNILSDPEKKKVYDETGSYGDDFNEHAFEAAYNFYRTIYKKIEKDDIVEFEKKYRGSDMEEEDLVNFYNENEGDLTTILECIPLSRNEDVDRFLEKYEELFKSNKLKKTKAYTQTKKKVILLDEDDEEGYEEEQKGLSDLASQILAKKGDAMSFLDSLAAKYGGMSGKKTKNQNTASKNSQKSKKKN